MIMWWWRQLRAVSAEKYYFVQPCQSPAPNWLVDFSQNVNVCHQHFRIQFWQSLSFNKARINHVFYVTHLMFKGFKWPVWPYHFRAKCLQNRERLLWWVQGPWVNLVLPFSSLRFVILYFSNNVWHSSCGWMWMNIKQRILLACS